MKMHSILTLLTITLTFSITEAFLNETPQPTVRQICQQTTDTRFCSNVLTKTLNTPSPSNKDIMNVTIREAQGISANTYFFISTLLRNAGEERLDLQNCVEDYAIVNMVLKKIVTYFDQGYYSKIIDLEDRVFRGVGMCKTDFDVPGYLINPLIERNRQMMVLVSMQKIVGHLVSS